MVEELDWSVGQILETLRKENLAENTLVIFTSDNGPWLIMNQQGGSAGLLREGKGSTWEGGMRVPGIAWWPGRIPAASVNTNVVCMPDLFSTSLKLAGARAAPGSDHRWARCERHSVARGTSAAAAGLFYRGTRVFAVRKDQWKLHLMTQKGYGQPKPDVHEPPLLFDLNIDPGETFNIAADHPNVVADLVREIETHRATVDPVKSQLSEVKPSAPGGPEKKL